MDNLHNCYKPYEEVKEKREIIEKGNYLLNSECCSKESCETLITDIQDTKFKCNDVFGKSIYNKLDEKGNIIGDTLCSQLNTKQKVVMDIAKKFSKIGGKTKRKRRQRRRTNRRRSKRSRKY